MDNDQKVTPVALRNMSEHGMGEQASSSQESSLC